MDDGEVELSDQFLLPNPNSSTCVQVSMSMDSYIDELLKNVRTCTHTHTCNPPAPEAAHTHTCYHTHTQVLPSEKDDVSEEQENHASKKPRRPLGNREAVRKYREKKKAHTAYLEEEVNKLRVANQQLIRQLQGQAVLEAEVVRLRRLLLDLRGKIDDELGVFRLQKGCNRATPLKADDCGLQSNAGTMGAGCLNNIPCFLPIEDMPLQGVSTHDNGLKAAAAWGGQCQPAIANCQAHTSEIVSAERCAMDSVEKLVASAAQAE
ncbi:hypothetical protein RJ640_025471 [Escallonia rubra]|uniref:BZIP domain-containing protein n=1 Tax=Escallonia rubra TaxID=112253 RepID=A0AA88QQM7_9ASTE|nr:hypothetical protein RJ640_025471 [Escallonia rubra]